MADSDRSNSATHSTTDFEADPLSKLHKMSTTAGLGSGDYVAINVAAVVAVVLGVASFLALLNEALLIFPIAGIVCAVIALRKVSHSGGTQSGKGLAWLGLVICLGVGGFVIGQQVISLVSGQKNEDQIVALIDQLGQNIRDNKATEAYDLFDQDFKDRVKEDAFVSRLNAFNSPQAREIYGELKAMKWNGRLNIDTDPRTGSPMGFCYALMSFSKQENGDFGRESMVFRKVADKWKIDSMPDLFPLPKAPKPG